jgi:hypothetical protein
MNIIYIVAGNYREFVDYIRKKQWEFVKTPILPVGEVVPEYRYVYGVDTLRGLSTIKGVYIGTWRMRKDIEAIQEYINIIKSRNIGFKAQEISKVISNVVI